jgi:hypothetical protein
MAWRGAGGWLVVLVAFAPAVVGGAPAGQAPSGSATATLQVAATFAARSSVYPSTHVLTFHVTGASAEASMDFTAGARVPSGTRVVLTAEVAATLPGALSIVEGPEDTVTGPILTSAPTVVASWLGSGRRIGRLTFRLDATPGVYSVPVNVRLTTED